MRRAIVAIVGAPNVGKSTLFNRMVGRRHAIVADEPGVTRDRLYGRVRRDGLDFSLIDTGGLTPQTDAIFSKEIDQQVQVAISEAALILFMLDGRAGITALDREITSMLRRSGVPLLLVANKIDGDKQELLVPELHELALGNPIAVSAEHGPGMSDLFDEIESFLGERSMPTESEDGNGPIRVAIVGRPNVGKSSLLNRLAGEERVMVSDMPGTTRDAIDTLITVDGREYLLIDTAGIRRPGRIREVIELFSVVRAKANIARCDVAIVVLDADEGISAQDTHIAGFIHDAFKPMVVAVNKWDLIDGREEQAKKWEEDVRDRLRFAKQVPMTLISALTGQRAIKVLDRVDEVHHSSGIQVSTANLNRWLEREVKHQGGSGKHPFRVYYGTQTGIYPPRFRFFCNDPKKAHFSFKRYLENSLREHFGFGASPIRIDYRPRGGARR